MCVILMLIFLHFWSFTQNCAKISIKGITFGKNLYSRMKELIYKTGYKLVFAHVDQHLYKCHQRCSIKKFVFSWLSLEIFPENILQKNCENCEKINSLLICTKFLQKKKFRHPEATMSTNVLRTTDDIIWHGFYSCIIIPIHTYSFTYKFLYF